MSGWEKYGLAPEERLELQEEAIEASCREVDFLFIQVTLVIKALSRDVSPICTRVPPHFWSFL